MKKPAPLLITGLFLSMVAHPLLAALNYQSLTDAQGRTIQAHIWKVVGNEAFVELQNGRKFRVPVTVFSPQSQAVIRQAGTPAPAPSTANPFDVAAGTTPPQPPAPPPPTPAVVSQPTVAISTPSPTQPAPFAPPPPTTTPAPFATPTPPASTPGAPAAFAPPPPSGALIDPTVAFLSNASILGKVDAAKISASQIGLTLKSKVPQTPPGEESPMPFGLTQDDFQAIAFSVTGLEGLDVAKMQQTIGFPEGVHFCLAITLAKPLDFQQVRTEISEGDPGARFEDYGGAVLAYPGGPGKDDLPQGYCVALKNQGSGSIILLGDKFTLQSAIDGNRQAQQSDLASEDVALAISIPASLMEQASAMVPPGPDGNPNPMVAALMDPIKKINKITLGMTFNQAMNANLGVHFSEPGVASTLAGMLQPMLGSFANQPTTPPFLKNLALVPEGDKIGLSLALQEGDLEGLMEMAMAQAMGGAMEGGSEPGFPQTEPADFTTGGPDMAPGPGGNPFGGGSAPTATSGESNPFAPADGGSAPAPAPTGNPFGTTDSSTPAPAPDDNPFAN